MKLKKNYNNFHVENCNYKNSSIVTSLSISELNNYLLNFLAKNLFNHEFDNCFDCKNISSQNLNNITYISDYKNNISKQEIIDVIEKLSFSPLIKNEFNFIIIKGIENSSFNIQSLLLRWIENIPKKTTILLLSNNINKIIPTLKSRLPVFNLNNSNYYILNDNEIKILDLLLELNNLNYYIVYDFFLKIDKNNTINILNKFALKIFESNYRISKLLLKYIYNLENFNLLNKSILIEIMLSKIIELNN